MPLPQPIIWKKVWLMIFSCWIAHRRLWQGDRPKGPQSRFLFAPKKYAFVLCENMPFSYAAALRGRLWSSKENNQWSTMLHIRGLVCSLGASSVPPRANWAEAKGPGTFISCISRKVALTLQGTSFVYDKLSLCHQWLCVLISEEKISHKFTLELHAPRPRVPQSLFYTNLEEQIL